MLKRLTCALLLVSTVLEVGCAASPAKRPEYVSLPPLDAGWSRVYFGAGTMGGLKLWSVHQVGPVFINNQLVGSTAKNEYFAVDLLPGTYEGYCVPEQPEKNFIDKRHFAFKAGETRYFACDMEEKGLGMNLGLIGALVSEYLTQTHLEEKPESDPDSRLVAYMKLQEAHL